VKKASPSAGVIREDFDPVAIARAYEAHAASAVSVLTEGPHFQGSLDDLSRVRQSISLPVLRKDFVIESYQVHQARARGADAVLLIAECLDDCHLRKLVRDVMEHGMTPLVEFYEPQNLPRVLESGATVIGINNRDLRTFQVDLGHTLRLRPEIPDDRIVVAESGIRSRDDVRRLEETGVHAILVGEHFMRRSDIGSAVDELLGRCPDPGGLGSASV
jgi:indole-3-glycerol phosphate synthase